MPSATLERSSEMTDPIPTKFRATDYDIIEDAVSKTDLNRSEIIRRAVRLLGQQKQIVNGYEFLLRLTA